MFGPLRSEIDDVQCAWFVFQHRDINYESGAEWAEKAPRDYSVYSPMTETNGQWLESLDIVFFSLFSPPPWMGLAHR